MTSVTVAQLFRLRRPAHPLPVLGHSYYVLGKPISGGLMGVAIVVCLLGVYRFWRQQNAMLRGKVYAGGYEINAIGGAILMVSRDINTHDHVSPPPQRRGLTPSPEPGRHLCIVGGCPSGNVNANAARDCAKSNTPRCPAGTAAS